MRSWFKKRPESSRDGQDRGNIGRVNQGRKFFRASALLSCLADRHPSNPVYIALLGLLFSCAEAGKHEFPIDPVTKRFILSEVKEGNGRMNAFFFIYPSTCGACTDSVMGFIRENPLRRFHTHYILPRTDSLKYIYSEYINGKIKYIDSYVLGKYGLEPGMNKLFVFEDTVCVYAAKLASENVSAVRREVSALVLSP